MSLVLVPACSTLLQTLGEGKDKYLSKTFSLSPGGSDSLSFPVNMRGRISVSARWKNQDQPLKMTLTDPSWNIAAQSSGTSPLNVSTKVSSKMSQDMREWTASIANESGSQVSGNFKVTYPYIREEGQTSSGGGETTQEPYPQEPPPDQGGNDQGGGYPPPSQDQGGYDQGQTQEQAPPVDQGGETQQQTDGGESPAAIGFGAHNFTIGAGQRQVVNLSITSPGLLKMKASWQGDASLALILNGPGQTGAYTRKEGRSPLWINFKITQAHLDQGNEWQVTVANFGSGSASGIISTGFTPAKTSTLTTIPGATALLAPRTRVVHYNFNLIGSSSGKDKEFMFSVTTPGTIKINAHWKGNANQVALILNGPGQTNYYDRKDGSSPLSIEFPVTEEHIQKGTLWKAKIANFDTSLTTSVGKISISHPQK